MIIASWKPYTPGIVTPHPITRYSSRTNFASVTDGLSNTLLIGEKHVVQNHFGEVGPASPHPDPPDPDVSHQFSGGPFGGDGSIYNKSPHCITRVAGVNNQLARSPSDQFNLQFGSFHTGVCQFVFVDGSVRACPYLLPQPSWVCWLLGMAERSVPDY